MRALLLSAGIGTRLRPLTDIWPKGLMPIRKRPLLEYTIARCRQSGYIKHTVVASEDRDTLELAKRLGADICLKRPEELSRDYVDIIETLRFSIDELETKKLIPDIVVYLSVNCPFRKRDFIDRMIGRLANGGYDSILPTVTERKSCWVRDNGGMRRIDEGFMPSRMKRPVHIGISGLGTASYADVIRQGDRLGQRIGIIELDDVVYTIDVGKNNGGEVAEMIIDKWWEKNF